MSGNGDDKEAIFKSFITEVKTIEEKDSIYTSDKQITRLLRPGSSYANLNPFSVLLLDYDAPLESIKKQYKKLSILLHPDKNPENREKAQIAFDILNKAYRSLEDEASRARALEVVEEAKFKVNQNIEEKRKKLKREGKMEPIVVDEDDPEKLKHAIHVLTMKLFADYERKRRAMEDRNTEDRKRKREGEIEEEEKKKAELEWNKNYEESREIRVSSWKNFQTTAKGKKKTFRPPKHKPETK